MHIDKGTVCALGKKRVITTKDIHISEGEHGYFILNLEGYAKNFLIYMEVSKYRNEDWEQQRRIDAARIIYNGMQG